MQDDSPWKPPSDSNADDNEFSVAPGADAPMLPTTAPVVPPPPLAEAPSAPVVPPPPPSAPPEWSAAGMPDAPSGIDPADDATLVTTSEPSRSSRSKWLVAGAATAVFAVGAAGVFAVANIAQSPQGGAGSADELGLSLLAAIENEDVLGVIDVLSPGERDVFRDPLVDLVSELTRLEVLSEAADLSRLLGVDVEFANESVESTSTNVADIINIDLRADATVSVDGAELPIGDLITDNVPDDIMTEMRGTRMTQTEEFDIRLTAIEEDGRWYFSVFHTVAELARAELDPGALIPLEGVGADGAETPEAAVDQLLDRVERLDLTGLIRSLNPGEAAALQRYAPLFLEEADAAIAEASFEWAITERELRFEGSGDTRTVLVDAITIEGTADGTEFRLAFADGCASVEAEGESFDQCVNGALGDADDVFEDAPDVKRLIDTVTEAFSDIEEVGLEMRQHDGAWYVSPTTTVTEAFLAVLRALDRTELDAIIEQAPAAFDDFADAIFGGFNGLPGSYGVFDDYGDDYRDDYGDDYTTDYTFETDDAAEPFDEQPTVDGGSTGNASRSSWEDCYSEFDPDAATACFESAIAKDGGDRSLMPLVLRYPECGYAETWGGGLYELPDDEFIALAEAARPCFLDLVERDELSVYELPTEIANLECFEGRNWYNVFDDADYDERYFDCLDAAFDEG